MERTRLYEQKSKLEQKIVEKNDVKTAEEDKIIDEFLEIKKVDKIFLYRLINKIEIDKYKNIYIHFNFSKIKKDN